MGVDQKRKPSIFNVAPETKLVLLSVSIKDESLLVSVALMHKVAFYYY